MSCSILDFKSYFDGESIKILNKKLKIAIQNYSFIHVTSEFNNNNNEINQNIKESQIMIVNSYEEYDVQFFVIGFKKTIIIIEQTKLHYLWDLLLYNKAILICFLFDAKNNFQDQISHKFDEIEIENQFFQIEYESLCKNFLIKLELQKKWNCIQPCILKYLLLQGYLKTTKNRLNELQSNFERSQTKIFNENDFIKLRNIGKSNNSNVDLIYHIEKEELLAIKTYLCNDETEKLSNREIEYYKKISHPFLPKFFGKTNNNIIIEFINGKSLINIQEMKLQYDEKLTIIFELMLVIEYLHRNHFVYRDLKPNNVIIDQNKTAILIDFDRMIKYDSIEKEQINTTDFQSLFAAPEIQNSEFSYDCDIYSLGMMICFIMNESISEKNNKNKINDKNLKKIVYKCTNLETKKRPSITNLIIEFFAYYYANIQIKNVFNKFEKVLLKINDSKLTNYFKNINDIEKNRKQQNYFGDLFLKGQYFSPNFDKGYYYYKKSADNKFSWAQVNLGLIYLDGKHCKQDIVKSINFFELAGIQNNYIALFHLGEIYLNILKPNNVNKAIEYYKKAANLNHLRSQKKLGYLFLENKNVESNIDESIKYFSLAANNKKDAESQYKLGLIYFKSIYNKFDFNESIKYFELAAKQNFAEAEKQLGDIYYVGRYCPKDIEKGFHYYKLAAEHGSSDAQIFLAFNYMTGLYLKQDFKKAIQLIDRASKQNNPLAKAYMGLIQNLQNPQAVNDFSIQYIIFEANQGNLEMKYSLAMFYFAGIYVKRDIQKALDYFFELANQKHVQSALFIGSLYLEGKTLPKDVNKALKYINIGIEQNDPEAQYDLGLIYMQGSNGPIDNNKAFHYFELAAEQNFAAAQFNLGVLNLIAYHIKPNIEKALFYLKKAADNNFYTAYANLGYIYEKGLYVKENINVAIKYYETGSSNSDLTCLLNLGILYFDGIKVTKNVNKALNYFELAAGQNHPTAFYMLGLCNYKYFDFKKALSYFLIAIKLSEKKQKQIIKYNDKFNRKRYLFIESDFMFFTAQDSINRSNFALGFLYFEGKSIKRDITQSINYYKEASSFNISQAKNNLGIIYKKGIDRIKQNLDYAIELFNEAINQKNDLLAMYNLAHLYIYDYDNNKQNLDNAIGLLIKLISIDGIKIAKSLLSIALIKKIGIKNKRKIEAEILKYPFTSHKLINEINEEIKSLKLYKYINFQKHYENYRRNTYVYDPLYKIFCTENILNQNLDKEKNNELEAKNVTEHFYEGFGHDLLI